MDNKKILIIAVAALLIIAGAYVLTSNKSNQTINNNPAPQSADQTATTAASIAINNFSFNPQTTTIQAGTTVTWTNNDSVTHNIRSANFNSPDIPSNGTFSFKFDNPGTYDYSCGIHPSMKGQIIVK